MTTPLIEIVREALRSVGLDGIEEISRTSESAQAEDTAQIFRVGTLLLRFVRDRDSVFVDLGSQISPATFHQFDDVEIALGWKSIDDVLAKNVAEDLGTVLARIRANRATLETVFSGERERLTRARVERAARERGREFARRLRRTDS